MKKHILLVYLLILSCIAKSQFLFDQKTITEIVQLEDSLSSLTLGYQETTVHSNFSISERGDKIYYPLCFKRTNEDFSPSCKVYYFYAGKDSMIAAINYNWDIMNYLENPDKEYVRVQMELDRRAEYLQKYRSLIKTFNKILGKPEYADELNYTLGSNFSGASLWKDNQKMVTLVVTFVPPDKNIHEYKYGKASLSVKIEWNTKKSDLMMYAKDNKSYMEFPAPDEFAVFEGGPSNLFEFLRSNIKYPKEARKKRVYGTVSIAFAVDMNGNIVNSKVVQGIGEGCDEEALRVVNMMSGKWKPAKKAGKNINSMHNIPIKFSLD